MKKTLLLLFFYSTAFCAENVDPYNYESDSNYQEYEAEAAPKKVFQAVIDPLYRTNLSAEIQSPVTKINKRLGESFQKGDLLIQLDDVVYESNFKKASAMLNKAKVELDGKKQLFNDHVASLFELKEAEANVAVAEADVATAQRDLNSTKILAPYDGRVVSLSIEENELPKIGTEIIEIVYDDTLLAKLLIPASLLKQFNIGDSFTITISQIDLPVKAKIKRIGSVIDPSSETVKIEAEIENKNHELKPGMTGIANFNNEMVTPILKETKNKTKEPVPTDTQETNQSEIKDKQEDSKKHSKEYPENIEKKSWNFFNSIIMSSIK